jgi:hypothetical protein
VLAAFITGAMCVRINNPEDNHLNTRHHEKIKSQLLSVHSTVQGNNIGRDRKREKERAVGYLTALHHNFISTRPLLNPIIMFR